MTETNEGFSIPQKLTLLVVFLLPFDCFSVDIGILVTPYQIAALVAILCSLMEGAIVGRGTLKKTSGGKWLFLFLCVVFLSDLAGTYKLDSLGRMGLEWGHLRASGFRWIVLLFKLVFMVAVYLLFVQHCRTRKFITACFNCILISSLIVSLYGIYQFIGSYLGWPYTLVSTLEVLSQRQIMSAASPEMPMIHRIQSFAGEPKTMARFLWMAIIVGIYAGYSRHMLWGKKKLKLIILIINMIVLILTFSTSGWLVLLCSLPIVFFILNRTFTKVNYTRIIIIICLCIILASLPVKLISQDKGRIDVLSSRLRGTLHDALFEEYLPVVIVRFAFEILPEHFFAGVGFGNFTFYLKDAYPRQITHVYSVHNMYLNLLIETGIFGLLMFLFFITSSVNSAYKLLSRSVDEFERTAIAAAISLALAFVVYSLYMPGISFEFFIAFGLLNGITAFSLHNRYLQTLENINKPNEDRR
jgi:hypothetical protein